MGQELVALGRGQQIGVFARSRGRGCLGGCCSGWGFRVGGVDAGVPAGDVTEGPFREVRRVGVLLKDPGGLELFRVLVEVVLQPRHRGVPGVGAQQLRGDGRLDRDVLVVRLDLRCLVDVAADPLGGRQ